MIFLVEIFLSRDYIRNLISELFGRDIKTIGKHISNVFKDKELEIYSTVAKFATLQNEGGREVKRDIEYYNLDLIISVGYRVKSQKGVRFRQWATSILKNYIQNGYVINGEKITNQRFKELENEVTFLKSKVENIINSIEDKTLKPKQDIFYDGQIFDAYIFINDLLKRAVDEIILIDNYIDKKEVYHIGASLKDLGKRWFAFSKLEIENLKILEKLKFY